MTAPAPRAPSPPDPRGPVAVAAGSGALRRRMTIAGVALILLIIGADMYEGWQDYRATVAANERVQLALGRAIAEQTARLVQESEVVLTDLSTWRATKEGRAAGEAVLSDRLRVEVERLPFIYAAVFAGPDGKLQATTQGEPISGRSIVKAPAFTMAQSEAGSQLYIGPPYTSRRDGIRTFALSRRVESADGGFLGVVVARVSFEYLATFYRAVEVTPDTSIELLRTDGTSLVHFPATSPDAADNAFVRQSFSTDQGSLEISHYAVAGGRRQFSVLRQVDGYPVVVAVSRPVSGVLQPWVQQEMASGARTVALALLAALLLLGLRKALARQDRMTQEQRRLEQSVADSRRADALGMLAASMAHDFNNVLTAIVGYAELAGKGLHEGAATLNIDRLLSATERARLLVRRVLTFDPHRSLSYQPIQVVPVIQEVLQQLQPGLPASVTIDFTGPASRAAILGDNTELHQVVMNLCTNAVKAMPGGGSVEIGLEAVEVREAKPMTLGSVSPGNWVRLCIADHGLGLTPQQVEKIFEPFYTTREPDQGTGIGLTVVRNIILKMHGALEIDSSPGAGTRAYVYWRAVSPPEPAHECARQHGRGETILVVDDDAELVVLAEDLLASLGYEPIGFSDPGAALDAFRRDPDRFHAVLTDERMAKLRGVEFAARIRAISTSVPIILMTGHRNTEVEVLAAKAGVAGILDKPLRMQTLQVVLDRELAATAH